MSAHPTPVTIELPPTAAAAGMARREVAAVPGVGGALGYRTLLLTTEIVACLVQDAAPDAPPLRLVVDVSEERVHVEVSGPAADTTLDRALHSHETPSLGGYGLQIVERVADHWGMRRAGAPGLWFELDR